MTSRFFVHASLGFFLFFLHAPSASIAQEFKLTPAREVASNPQRFWARGVIFLDTLTALPSASTTKFADRRLHPFSTKTVGDCLATPDIAPVLRDLTTGRDYIFTATVLTESRGLIRKRPVYRVVVEGVSVPAQDATNLPSIAQLAEAALDGSDPYSMRLQTLRRLIVRVQESIAVVIASEKISREQLFDPASPHFEKLVAAARRAVGDLEVETNIPGREHLAQMLVALVAWSENRLPPALPTSSAEQSGDPVENVSAPSETITVPAPAPQINPDPVDDSAIESPVEPESITPPDSPSPDVDAVPTPEPAVEPVVRPQPEP